MEKIPDEWVGPFVVGTYDRRKSQLLLKRQDASVAIINDVVPSLFIPRQQIDDFVEVASSNKWKVLGVTEEGPFFRVNMDSSVTRVVVDQILEECYESNIYPKEADVDPMRRWFSDTGAYISAEQNCLFIDFETWPRGKMGFDDEAKREHQLISYAAEDYNTGQRWFRYDPSCTEQGERELLLQFFEDIKDYDTILAWNGNDYDFFVLRARCKKHNINVHLGFWNFLDYMLTVKKCLMSISRPDFKRSFALDSIGENVLGVRKIKLSVKPFEMQRLILEGRAKELEEYNLRDVEIMTKLERKEEFLQLHLTVCSICRTFPNRYSLYPNYLADGLMLRLAIQEGRHFKSRLRAVDNIDDDKYEGAYVKDAELGYHQDVQVLDFASLYPSIMISWNMSPETKIWENRKYNLGHNDIIHATATGIKFRSDFVGLIPMALHKLIKQRKVYNTKMKEAEVGSEDWKRFGHESTALKVVANSMYGLTGSPYSRYYDKDIARSITLTGQLLIKETIRFAQDAGFRVIAGDTDSIFVKMNEDEARKLQDDINAELIPKICKDSGCKTTTVKLDFDKGYRYLLIQSKKRYSGKLSLHKGRPAPDDMKPDVKGLEFQRSDQIRLTQRMQMEYLDRLLQPDCSPLSIERDLTEFALKFFDLNVPWSREDLEITQSVSKKPEDYPQPTQAAKVAMKMIAEGREFYVGMKIPYIVASSEESKKGSKIEPIHADDFDGYNFDRMYYWKRRILEPIARLVEVRFPNHHLDQLASIRKDPRQTTLCFGEPVNPVYSTTKFQRVKIKMPKLKEPKLKKPKSTQPTLRQPKIKRPKIKQPKSDDDHLRETTLTIDEAAGKDTVIGISKLAKASTGKPTRRLRLNIILPYAHVVITTTQDISESCLSRIQTIFPWVQIESKPI